MYRITFTPNAEYPRNTLTMAIPSDPDTLQFYLNQFMCIVEQEMDMPGKYTLDGDCVVTDILDSEHVLGTDRPLLVTEWVYVGNDEQEWAWHDSFPVGSVTWEIA